MQLPGSIFDEHITLLLFVYPSYWLIPNAIGTIVDHREDSMKAKQHDSWYMLPYQLWKPVFPREGNKMIC